MSARLLGVDIGTTGLRAALFDVRGKMVADASSLCPLDAPHPGWAEVDPNTWWRRLKSTLATLAERASLDDVAAIAVTGQAPTAVLVDDRGEVVRPAVLWLDTRASAEANEMGTHAYYLGPKLLWL